MVRKKRRVIRRRKPVVEEEPVSARKIISSKFKFGIVFRNLILFVLLFLISYILYLVSGGVWIDIFNFLWIIFAFISLAFFIALLVLLFLKLIKK